MEKFRSKYRIRTHRKPRWDYSAGALYFVTIVTQYRECNLGVIVNNEMQLSDFGNIVKHEWLKSFTIRRELILHQYAIMPNHLHAVFEICNIHRNNTTIGNGNDNGEDRRDTRPCVSTESRAIESSDNLMIKRNPPVRLPKSISSFMAGFKSAVNTKIDDYMDANQIKSLKYNRKNHFFQPNYYDHIIRNEQEYRSIKYYIANNPRNWNNDTLFINPI